jgi:hypothetical protein
MTAAAARAALVAVLLGVEAVTLAGSDCARSVRTKLAPLGAWVVASGSVIAEPKRETRALRGYEVWNSLGPSESARPLKPQTPQDDQRLQAMGAILRASNEIRTGP